MGMEWRTRVDFAECAEALGIATDEIVARIGNDFVVYTLDDEMWSAILKRDKDGILRPVYRKLHRGMYEDFKQGIEKIIREEFQ